jgi:hypothetical protein
MRRSNDGDIVGSLYHAPASHRSYLAAPLMADVIPRGSLTIISNSIQLSHDCKGNE